MGALEEQPKDISKEAVKSLQRMQFPGRIVVVEDAADVKTCVRKLRRHTYLGFDTETRPHFKKGRPNTHKVALLQLATEEEVYLFRLQKTGMTKSLSALLSDTSTIKAGAAIREDLNALQVYAKFEAGGFTDVQQMAEEAGYKVKSLRRLAALLFHQRVSKTQRLSNWEADSLTEPQLRYAATDAWVSLLIFLKLKNQCDDRK